MSARSHSLTFAVRRRTCPPAAFMRAFTLAEVMIGIIIFTIVSLAVLGSMMHARRLAEESIVRNIATSIVYGLVEQMKSVNLSLNADDNRLPSPPDGDCAVDHVKVRVDNSSLADVCLKVSTSAAPDTTPAPGVTAASLGATSNVIGPFDLSGTSGASTQSLSLDLWLWVEDDYQPVNMQAVTRVTLVYTYTVNIGIRVQTFRDTVRFIRANRGIPKAT